MQHIENYLKGGSKDEGGLLASTQAMMFATKGRPNEARQKIDFAKTRSGYGHFHHTEYNIACAYAVMRERDLAIDWFEKSIRDGLSCYPLFEKDPNLDSLRDDPRFQRTMQEERSKWEHFREQFGSDPERSGSRANS